MIFLRQEYASLNYIEHMLIVIKSGKVITN